MNDDCLPNTLIWRVKELERNYTEVNDKLDKVMENHLPHINIELQSLSTKVTIAAVLNIGAIILAAVLLKLLS